MWVFSATLRNKISPTRCSVRVTPHFKTFWLFMSYLRKNCNNSTKYTACIKKDLNHPEELKSAKISFQMTANEKCYLLNFYFYYIYCLTLFHKINKLKIINVNIGLVSYHKMLNVKCWMLKYSNKKYYEKTLYIFELRLLSRFHIMFIF